MKRIQQNHLKIKKSADEKHFKYASKVFIHQKNLGLRLSDDFLFTTVSLLRRKKRQTLHESLRLHDVILANLDAIYFLSSLLSLITTRVVFNLVSYTFYVYLFHALFFIFFGGFFCFLFFLCIFSISVFHFSERAFDCFYRFICWGSKAVFQKKSRRRLSFLIFFHAKKRILEKRIHFIQNISFINQIDFKLFFIVF